MTIEQIQDGVIKEKGEIFAGTLFTFDISTCNTLSELMYMLGQYGYDREESLAILNVVIVK